MQKAIGSSSAGIHNATDDVMLDRAVWEMKVETEK